MRILSETSLRRSKPNFTKVVGEFSNMVLELNLNRPTATVKAFDSDNLGFTRTNMKLKEIDLLRKCEKLLGSYVS